LEKGNLYNSEELLYSISVSLLAFFTIIIGISVFYNAFIEFWDMLGSGVISGYNNWLLGEIGLFILALSVMSAVFISPLLLIKKTDTAALSFIAMIIFYGLYELILSFSAYGTAMFSDSPRAIFGVMLVIFGVLSFITLSKKESDSVNILFALTTIVAILSAWLPSAIVVLNTGASLYDNFWSILVDSIKNSSNDLPFIMLGGPFALGVLLALLIGSLLAFKAGGFYYSSASKAFFGFSLTLWIVGFYISVTKHITTFFYAIDFIGYNINNANAFFSVLLSIGFLIMIISIFTVYALEFSIEIEREEVRKPGIVVKEKPSREEREEIEEELEVVDIEDLDLEL